jgi:hypothetical protein
MDRKALLIAAVIGLIAQLFMVILGHFILFVADNLFALAGVAISMGAGAIYFRKARPGSLPLMGGAAAAAIAAFLGILVSLLLGDVPAIVLPLGTMASALAGIAGAAIARTLRARKARRA